MSNVQAEDATAAPDARLRIAVVSDTHGHLDSRIAKVVERCQVAVHAGDIGGVGVLDVLARPGRAESNRQVVAVRGNNDIASKWDPDEHPALSRLPWEASLPLPGGLLVVTHGHQIERGMERRHTWLRERFPDARVVVYGHTHRRCIVRGRRPWLVNPGAAGRDRTFGGPSLVVIDIDDDARWRLRTVRFEPATPQARPPRTRSLPGASRAHR